MKILISTLMFLVSTSAIAQVNLDQRINVSHTDVVFQSANEPNVAYMMPKMLRRLSEVKVIAVGDRIKVQFDVGIPESEFARVEGLLATYGKVGTKASVVRALEATLGSGTDIEDQFKPLVAVAGDPRDLTGPVRYVLSVRNRGPKGKKNSTALMLQKLFGNGGIDNVVNLDVNFDAISLGVPYKARTAIPVFAGEQNGAPPLVVPKTGLKSQFALFGATIPNLSVVPDVQYLLDKNSGCWAKPTPGVICLR